MGINTICICGGGSLGLVCAGVFLSRGVNVNILSGHPDSWHKIVKIYDPEGKEYGGVLSKVSSNPKDVIPTSDLVFLTVPGFLIEKTLKDIKPYLSIGVVIGAVVSSTGFFFSAHEILSRDYCLFGFQRVPYIARQRKYGEIGDLLGYKSNLNIVIENCADSELLKKELEKLFGTPINLLNNFYEVSLSNSNPILHTGRLYSMWKESKGMPLSEIPLFYSDWTVNASKMIIRMDEEFQRLLEAIGIPKSLPPLLEYYESTDAISLTNKIRSIEAFQSIKSPMVETTDGYILDVKSRYFTEDFPYGLKYIKDLAEKNSLNTPMIEEVYNWGMSIMN